MPHLFHYPADTFFKAKHFFGTRKDLRIVVAQLPKCLVWCPYQPAAVIICNSLFACWLVLFSPSSLSTAPTCQNQRELKWKSTDFTHKGQFTRHGESDSACENGCIMSSVVSGALSLVLKEASRGLSCTKVEPGSNQTCYSN